MNDDTYLIIRTLSGNLIGTRLPGQYNDSEVVLKNIMDIIQEDIDGTLFYSMLPHFILYENEPVTFNTRYIIEQSVPTDSLVEMYKKSFDKYILNFKENSKETARDDLSEVKFNRGRLN